MALSENERQAVLDDFRKQREDLWQNNFFYAIGWGEREFLDTLNEFEDRLITVTRSEPFELRHDRLPFLMVFPPPNAGQLKERLIKLGFSETYNQIQIKLNKVDDIEYNGRQPYILFDLDPGYLVKNTRYSEMILQRMRPIRRRLTFFEAVAMTPFMGNRAGLRIDFQMVITGSRYVNEDTSPAIDFAASKAMPIINHFDLDKPSQRIGIPSCVTYSVFKPLTDP